MRVIILSSQAVHIQWKSILAYNTHNRDTITKDIKHYIEFSRDFFEHIHDLDSWMQKRKEQQQFTQLRLSYSVLYTLGS